MARTLIAAGNWKMHKTSQEASVYAEAFLTSVGDFRQVEIIICPPFTSLPLLSQRLAASPVKLGAQNMHWETKGAFTGEIAPAMIKEFRCSYVILGHSERRHIFRETSQEVGQKVQTAINWGISPILCVGETLEEREKGKTEAVVAEQLMQGVDAVPLDKALHLVIAYEPVWAIGTGKAATPSDAEEVIGFIREKLNQKFNRDVAQKIRILYGGSVTPENVFEFVVRPEIDGTLVGGASLDPGKFWKIVEETYRASRNK
ncbi:MAG: triose-phosphate isomerase [Atribacterota bacterium]|nr:triose-phosphate isomerase [Atribacterota bacterium]